MQREINKSYKITLGCWRLKFLCLPHEDSKCSPEQITHNPFTSVTTLHITCLICCAETTNIEWSWSRWSKFYLKASMAFEPIFFSEQCPLPTLDARGLLVRQRRGASERVELVGERPLVQAVKSFERADPITLPCISPESKFDPGNLIGRLKNVS